MPSPQRWRTIILAGLAGELAFEIYALIVSPILFGVSLEPANLVIALTRIGTGLTLPYALAFIIHFGVGSVVFSSLVWFAHRITSWRLAISGAATGVALWFVAQGILAPVVGRSFMMDFGAYTQSSFIGHVGMTLVIAMVMKGLQRPVQREASV